MRRNIPARLLESQPAGLPSHLASLLTPEAYPHKVGEIRLVETHISWVLLTGDLVYKIKRPVRYAFVDLRSPQTRRFLCEEEVRLNRRFAPELYEAVVPINADAGTAHIGGAGEVIEHAVRMRQFARSEELAALIAESRVAPDELRAFGQSLAAIHCDLPADTTSQFGALATVRSALLDNLEQLEAVSKRAGAAPTSPALSERLQRLLDRHSATIRNRKSTGHVRECHGDLHCGNVVRRPGGLIAFDCLEFEPAFRWIDVAHEIAFLWMDLRRRGGAKQAAAFLGAYLESSGDYEAARLVGMYGAHCALVRAKVAALRMPEQGGEEGSSSQEFESCVDCAGQLLGMERPALILMSGLSGSGKTWVATRLAMEIGAVHLRSDIERKRLAGVPERSSTGSAVGGGAYEPEMNARTYRRLADCANDVLAGGLSAVVDATFQRREDRAHFIALAAKAGVPIAMVRCVAPDAVLEARIRERARAGSDASEANTAVLEWQRKHYEPIDLAEGLLVIDADTTRECVVADAIKALAAAKLPGTAAATARTSDGSDARSDSDP